MSRVLQVILGLFGLFLLLLLAAVIIIPMVVDPNDYREQIARAVEEETGRSFEIEGEISLSVFPWLGLEVGGMRLGNPPGFGDQPFAEIGSAAVGARLFPLLSRRLEVSTLRLDGLRVHLVRLRDGSDNWSDLGGAEAAPAEPRTAGEGGFNLERIDGLRLTDARIRFEDRQAGTDLVLDIPRLATSELAPGQPFDVDAQTIASLDGGATEVSTELAARVLLADDFGSAVLREVKLAGEAASGEERHKFTLRVPVLQARFEGPQVAIEGLELGFETRGPQVPGSVQAGSLAAPSVSVDLAAQTLAVPTLRAELAGLSASAELSGTRIVDAPSLAGRVEIAEFSPRALLQRLGEAVPETADPGVLARAAMAARFRAGGDEVQFEELRFGLDDTEITGTAGLGFGAVTRVRADLVLDAIDLDRYLPPEPEADAPPPPSDDVPLAFDWLEGLDLDATFRAGRLTVNRLQLTDIEGRAVARDGVLTLQPFGAALYGGQVRGSARLDARRTPATFTLEQSLSALEVLPFARDLAGFERLAGIARLDAKLSTTAASAAGLMSGLNGELAFDVSDGVFKGINLWYEIQRANALARGRTAPARSSPDTEFRQLMGTAVITDGRLVNQDLVGGLPFLALAGRGEVNLAESALDYRLTATVVRQAIDEATGETSELAGASVPLRLSGSLDSPSVSVDLGGLLRDRATQEALRRLGVDQQDGKTTEQELKDQAEQRLRGLRDRLRRDN
jgi:AsmA protein